MGVEHEQPVRRHLGVQDAVAQLGLPRDPALTSEEFTSSVLERYAVGHAVLDDPELVTWQAYTARAWPTLVVVDPEGYIVASMSGEGHGPGIARLVEELVAEHAAKGTLRRGNAPYAPPPPPVSALRFPGKVAILPDGSFVVSDTAHHQVVQLEPDLATERRRWGGAGEFDEPQGVLLLPTETAAEMGYDLLVADSVNHQVKGISLSDNEIIEVKFQEIDQAEKVLLVEKVVAGMGV